MTRMLGDVLLVGSVPLQTAEEVFRICAQTIGNAVSCLPDGEVGDRSVWVNFQAYRVFYLHPQLETLHRPQRGPAPWSPAGLDDLWLFRIKPGVGEIYFEDLQYARVAIDSYRTFRALREQGVIPASVRFQVSLPLPLSGFNWFFPEAADHVRIGPAYEAAMRREIEKIVSQIPTHDLAIQWDVCREVLELEGFFPSPGDSWERYVGQVRRLSPAIPEEVLLGYHLCYADLGHRHMKEPHDLSLCVRMANATVTESGRRVDWIHMPVPRNRADDAYFVPLRDLTGGDTRVYLGLVHYTDGVEGTQQRLQTAKQYCTNFGVATECGFGRRDPKTVPELLQIHRTITNSLTPPPSIS